MIPLESNNSDVEKGEEHKSDSFEVDDPDMESLTAKPVVTQ
jgi:hypothetical protein